MKSWEEPKAQETDPNTSDLLLLPSASVWTCRYNHEPFHEFCLNIESGTSKASFYKTWSVGSDHAPAEHSGICSISGACAVCRRASSRRHLVLSRGPNILHCRPDVARCGLSLTSVRYQCWFMLINVAAATGILKLNFLKVEEDLKYEQRTLKNCRPLTHKTHRDEIYSENTNLCSNQDERHPYLYRLKCLYQIYLHDI